MRGALIIVTAAAALIAGDARSQAQPGDRPSPPARSDGQDVRGAARPADNVALDRQIERLGEGQSTGSNGGKRRFDGVDADDPPPTPYGRDTEPASGCVVVHARLGYNGRTDAAPEAANAPLTFPSDYSAPAPGAVGSQATGASNGPIPATAPAQAFLGNDFEYHSDVATHRIGQAKTPDTHNPCTSEQYVRFFRLQIDPATNTIVGLDAKSTGLPGGQDRFWPVDRQAPMAPRAQLPGRSIFDGDTQTGTRRDVNRGGGQYVYYQGTPSVIHWIDAPGLRFNTAAAGPRRIDVLVALIKSVTYDGGHGASTGKPSGWLCYSGHTVAVDTTAGAPLPPAQAAALFAAVRAKNGAANNQKDAATALNTPAAQGGFQGQSNPEFRDLGCYHFG
ncbi:MAG TPA: hypothetical protein VKT30_01775 [Caulobacteraceae bacterium]|nr:hypothetical protein [Caulobacteraceae bacterium]